ncbi:hypothetical protein [Sporosarcina sp. G11-34]|uniref:hypothetical protein n=1 Tax=Sporosarcina sp. G11-34 TaxID=2849605 RepID=UPI0022A9406B|nr:hypothetical protein [Sporosarcina sp. G11-34]MCZ2256923.1 group-specific protein [Sporosarcina sp. G11-34]
MGTCQLDHSPEDVKKKLTEQKPFLPRELYDGGIRFLKSEPSQLILNELFHVLKKYDLASEAEKLERNESLNNLIK